MMEKAKSVSTPNDHSHVQVLLSGLNVAAVLEPAGISAMCMTPAANITKALSIGQTREGDDAAMVLTPDGVCNGSKRRRPCLIRKSAVCWLPGCYLGPAAGQ